jgi:hypothetical protein
MRGILSCFRNNYFSTNVILKEGVQSGMKWNYLVAALVGIVVALLGLMWFLQGAGILQLCPVLCVANCECITGGSPFWEAAGAIAFVIGILIAVVSVRGIRAP